MMLRDKLGRFKTAKPYRVTLRNLSLPESQSWLKEWKYASYSGARKKFNKVKRELEYLHAVSMSRKIGVGCYELMAGARG